MSVEKDITQIKDDLKEHQNSDKSYYQGFDTEIKEIKTDIKGIKENHLAHIQTSMASLTTDMGWIKETLEKNGFVKKSEFSVVKRIVFGTVTLILIGFAGVVGQVIVKVLSL